MNLVSLNKRDDIKVNMNLESFLNPDYVYVPITSNVLLVKYEDILKKNMPINNGDAKVLCPVSGYIRGTRSCLVGYDNKRCLVIENDFREERLREKKRKDNEVTHENIKGTLREYGYVELLERFEALDEVENIVVSVVEDEAYVRNRIMLFKKYLHEALDMMDLLGVLYKSKEVKLVVKNIDSDIIDDCLNVIGTYPNIKITLVKDLYLLGREEFLLSHLKYDKKDTLYLSMEELILLYELMILKKVSDTKIITVSGDGLKEGKVLLVKKYTMIKEIIDECVVKTSDDVVYIANGLMSGYFIDIKDAVLNDDISAVLVMKRKDVKELKCINCGKCVSVCPKKIDVVASLKRAKTSKNCIDCGLCSYVCPAMINLRKYVRGAK